MLEELEGELVGLIAITQEFDRNCKATRKVQVLLQQGVIKGRKVGQVWVSTKDAVAAAKAAMKAKVA
jgi:hypothetical protein